MDHALIGRRHIQQQGAVVAHRTKIQLKQSTRALNRAVLILGPEPTLTDGHIHLRRIPNQIPRHRQHLAAAQILVHIVQLFQRGSVALAVLALLMRLFSVCQASRYHTELAFAGLAALVAHPAHIRAANGNQRVRLQFADQGIIPRPIILKVRHIGAFRTVKPNLTDMAVIGKQLR